MWGEEINGKGEEGTDCRRDLAAVLRDERHLAAILRLSLGAMEREKAEEGFRTGLPKMCHFSM